MDRVTLPDTDRDKDRAARVQRFRKSFAIQSKMWDLVNSILDNATVKIRSGSERDLSLLIGASLGKALKTYYAIYELCVMGWGEDALILLRSNVNLLINVGYILGDGQPTERAADFIAFSAVEREKYLKTAHGAKPPWKSAMSDAEEMERAKRWAGTSIKQRADSVPKFHYTTGYTLYSSFE